MRAGIAEIVLALIVVIPLAGCAQPVAAPDPEPGVPLALAVERARTISNLRYELSLQIPAAQFEPITGRATIRLTLKDTAQPLVLDFGDGSQPATTQAADINGKPGTIR